MTIYRPGQRLYYPGSPGVRVVQPVGGAVTWWMAAGVAPTGVYQAKGAASYAASLVNLANPGTYDLTPLYVDPAWNTLTGWAMVGGWPWTFFLTGIAYASTDIAVLVRFSNRQMGYVLGTVAAGTLSLLPYNAPFSTSAFWSNGGTYSQAVPDVATGVMGLSGATAYLDGVALGAIPAGAASGGNIIISGSQQDVRHFFGNILAVWIGPALTDPQYQTVSAAMAAL